MLTKIQVEKFPINHFSPSSIRSYLEDRQNFFRRYVRFEFDNIGSPAMSEGSAFHKALETFWTDLENFQVGGNEQSAKDFSKKYDWKKAIAIGIKEIDKAIERGEIEFGKTGSYEKSCATVERAVEMYQVELPEYTPKGAEVKVVSDFENLEGELMPIPLKTFSDLVAENKDGELIIVDHKLVSRFSEDQGFVNPAYLIQAVANFFTVRKEFGKDPKYMIFDELKKSKNKDKSPQLNQVKVEFTALNIEIFLEIYRRIVWELTGQSVINQETGEIRFLPNPFTMFGGKESWLDFCEEVASQKNWILEEIKEARENAYSGEEVEAIDL